MFKKPLSTICTSHSPPKIYYEPWMYAWIEFVKILINHQERRGILHFFQFIICPLLIHHLLSNCIYIACERPNQSGAITKVSGKAFKMQIQVSYELGLGFDIIFKKEKEKTSIWFLNSQYNYE